MQNEVGSASTCTSADHEDIVACVRVGHLLPRRKAFIIYLYSCIDLSVLCSYRPRGLLLPSFRSVINYLILLTRSLHGRAGVTVRALPPSSSHRTATLWPPKTEVCRSVLFRNVKVLVL